MKGSLWLQVERLLVPPADEGSIRTAVFLVITLREEGRSLSDEGQQNPEEAAARPVLLDRLALGRPALGEGFPAGMSELLRLAGRARTDVLRIRQCAVQPDPEVREDLRNA